MTGKSVTEVRSLINHPVIDVDGHTMESLAILEPFLREEGFDPTSPTMRRLLPGIFGPPASWYDMDDAERRRTRTSRPPFWGAPAANTRDLATALSPQLMYKRLDEIGIDVSVVYPSLGLIFMHYQQERERRAACRALNRANAVAFAPLADRLVPVAAIPMHSPAEAIEALEHAVQELDFKAVLLAGYVQRPVPAVAERTSDPIILQYAQWLDMYGIDSAYDYDPVWQRCVDLGVSVAFHSGSIGWGPRASISNYMYNHLGHLAEGGHSLAKALFMGGVTHRFPDLPFVFLEGGAAWGAILYSDLVGHWDKRSGHEMRTRLDPANIDSALLADLLTEYGSSAGNQPEQPSRSPHGRAEHRRMDGLRDRARRRYP